MFDIHVFAAELPFPHDHPFYLFTGATFPEFIFGIIWKNFSFLFVFFLIG